MPLPDADEATPASESPVTDESAEPVEESAAAAADEPARPAPARPAAPAPRHPPEPRPAPARPEHRLPRAFRPVTAPNPPPPRNVPALGEAIDEVYRVIETLQRVLEDLDEVLETLEVADRQRNEDAKEIDRLRQALRQLQTQRPREGAPRDNPPRAHARPALDREPDGDSGRGDRTPD